MLKTKKPSREEAKALVLKLFEQTDRPILVGPACIALGPYWGLSDTEGLFTELVMRGQLRMVTDAEKKAFDCRTGFMLAGVPKQGGAKADEAEVPVDREVAHDDEETHSRASEPVQPAVSQVRATRGLRPSEPGFDELCVGYPDGD